MSGHRCLEWQWVATAWELQWWACRRMVDLDQCLQLVVEEEEEWQRGVWGQHRVGTPVTNVCDFQWCSCLCQILLKWSWSTIDLYVYSCTQYPWKVFHTLTGLICHWPHTKVASFPGCLWRETALGMRLTLNQLTESASWTLQVHKDQQTNSTQEKPENNKYKSIFCYLWTMIIPKC